MNIEKQEPRYHFYIEKEAKFELEEITKYLRLSKLRTIPFIINRYYRYLVKKGKIVSVEEKVK